ncbi:unnamed protein product [Dracunculus medinensis]|uniref:Sugar phosphate phosphatase n=1 Tax=Dracunculus medinensis TaxID=318479 RepID=A0A0N4UQW7_DRAME|nr:unnamed protein product [Dracunculus medinensis]
MPSVEELPPVLNGLIKGSFVYKTIKDRWPKIIGKVVDQVHRHYHTHVATYHQEGSRDITTVISELSELMYRISTDKPLKDLTDNGENLCRWNKILSKLRDEANGEVTWYSSDWIFAECYLYRFMAGIFSKTATLNQFDPFEAPKQSAFIEKVVGKYLAEICLWGNTCDLSLSGGDSSAPIYSSVEMIKNLDEKILSNDIAEAETILMKAAGQRVDLVLDNAGFELFVDFVLADFLISMLNIGKVVCHGKSIPWFVSDVTVKDFNWLLRILGTSNNEVLREMGLRWQGMLAEGKLEFRAEEFWTLPFPYCDMHIEDPDLYNDLKKSTLLIFKGDLNYRKLIGDRKWPHGTLFKTALRKFAPAPILALRILKAETLVGLSSDIIESINRQFGDKEDWMVAGEYAVVQLSK